MHQGRRDYIPEEGMSRPQGPCYKCADREIGCHSTCEKYIEYQADNELYKEMVRMARNYHSRIAGYESEKRKRLKKKYT